MADEKSTRKRRSSGDDGKDEAKGRSSKRRLSGTQLAQRARDELAEMTGLEPEAVTGLHRGEDGTWTVTVELLELSRVPETDDLLGSYEAQIDEQGELVGYRRLRRYARSQGGDEVSPS